MTNLIVIFFYRVPIQPGTENGEILKVPYIEGLRKMSLDKAEFFYAKIMVNKSDHFTREGMDIRSKTDIDAKTSLYGGTIKVKGLYESLIQVDIPPGTSSHQSITLQGKGLRIGGLKGNHIVDIGISMEEIKDETLTVLGTVVADLEEEQDCNLTESNVVIPIVDERKF